MKPSNFFILLTCLFIFGCKAENPTATEIKPDVGGMSLAFNKSEIPSNVMIVTATLTRSGYTSIIKNLNILTDSSAEITVPEVIAGTWSLKVDAMDVNNILLYTGNVQVTVIAGQTVSVVLTLQQVPQAQTGIIKINIVWGGTVPKTGWIDFEKNSILQKSVNSWENVGVCQPRVYKFGDKYFMYYQMIGSISSVGLATSADGTTWNRVGERPIIAPSDSSWDFGGTTTGPIFKTNTSYEMLYQGYSPSEGRHFVGRAYSTDGITWTRPVGNRIIINNQYIFHAADVIKIGNLYYLYYLENYSVGNATSLAVSEDGVVWTKKLQDPVLKKTLAWEVDGVYFNSIVYKDSLYQMVYSDNGYYTNNFGYATSLDGITWKKNQTPIFTKDNTYNKWADAGISYPNLAIVNNQLRLYYMGAVGSAYERKIGYAYFK